MYAKVFKQILSSSIAEDYLVRLVFEDFLILADPDGTVDMTAESIARHTNVPLEIVQRGIESLSQPDLKSRTSDHDGRRLILINDHREWGWKIVNYSLYAAIRTNEERRSYMSNYMAKRRSAAHACKQPVNSVNSSLAELANEDVDVPVSGNGKEQTLLSGKPDEIVSNSHSVRKNLTPLELVVSGSCKEKKEKSELVHAKREQMQDVGANAIYSAYPRKQGEPSALKSIQRAILRIEKDKTLSRQDAVAWLLERTVKYARETAGTQQRFIKLPAGWFNDARYNDETPPATGAHMNPRVYIDEALLKTLAAPAATGEHMNPAASVNEWLVASAVMDRCRLSGIQLRVVLTDLVRQEADAGADPAALTDRMVWAWEEYTKAKPKLKYSPKAEIFFGGGDWRNPKGWAWKDGQNPANRYG